MSKLIQQKITRCIFCSSIALAISSCSNSESTDQFNIPHYRIKSTVNSEPVHLQVNEAPNWVVAVIGETSSSFDDRAAWVLASGSTSTINLDARIDSLYQPLGSVFHLELNPEGTMQNLHMVSFENKTESGDWFFERQSSGFCYIKNKTLGSELTLTIETSTTPFSVIMAPIDSSLVQSWVIEAYLRPSNNFEQLCNGEADAL